MRLRKARVARSRRYPGIRHFVVPLDLPEDDRDNLIRLEPAYAIRMESLIAQ